MTPVPFTLYEAVAAYLYDCWGSLHEAAGKVPVSHAGGKLLGVFCLDYTMSHNQKTLLWFSESYEKKLVSEPQAAVHDMCGNVINDLVGNECTDNAKANLVADLKDDIDMLMLSDE